MDDARFSNDPFEKPGSRLSHYVVIRRIASGGMGEVYEATDERLHRQVALKVLPPWSQFDEKAVERFRREARAASSLNHPSICTIYEFDEFEGRPYIAMELVDGPSLETLIGSGPVDPVRAAEIVADVALGLAHAHSRSVTHRDIKPANILLTDSGRTKIADFGLARVAGATTLTAETVAVGTVAYMSPEQARGEDAGPKSDVWSLGAVYHELLTGERPFKGEYASAILYGIVNDEPSQLGHIRDRFGDQAAGLIAACLDKDPAQRPDVSQVCERVQPEPLPAIKLDPVRSQTRRGPLVATGIAVVLILGMLFWFRPDPPAASLTNAGVAMLVPAENDLVAAPGLEGFVAAASDAVEDIAERRGLVRHVLPYELLLREGISTAAGASASFGATYVIENRLNEDATSITFSLVSAADGEIESSRTVAFEPGNLQSSFGMAVLAALSLLGLPDSANPQIVDPYAPSEPGAFEVYSQAMVMVEAQRSAASLGTGIEMLQDAAELSPEFAPIHAGLGKANLYLYNQTKDPSLLESAERHCDRAIELDQNLRAAYITLSQVHQATGRLGQAKRVLGSALGTDSTSIEALLSLADLYALSDDDRLEAEKTYRKAIQLDPGHWDSYRRFGRFYLGQSRFAEAATQFRHLIRLLPENPRAYNNLAVAYYLADSLDLAFEYWEQGLEIDPTDYFSTANLGTNYFYAGRYAEASRWFERALELNHTDYVMWGNLGTAYRWSDADDADYIAAKRRAIMLAEQALDANPRDHQTRAKLAGYHAEIGDTALARGYLAEFGTGPSDDLSNETVFEIGTAYEAVGDRETAIDWIGEALDRGYSTAELIRYPGLDSLRTDLAFVKKMQDVGRVSPEENQ